MDKKKSSLYLPQVDVKNIKMWDEQRKACCGYLNKKADTSIMSSISFKPKWQKKWFLIKLDISDKENYCLQYFNSPDDSNCIQSHLLESTIIEVATGSNASNTFQLTFRFLFILSFIDTATILTLLANWLAVGDVE